ncbi:hypothetical protein M3Y97_00231700 [Aphelenchoides bicaudatus]|nr:hypothetical protein M3Y97_00231700 [Aphelenchoides bicaudatus]
MPPSGTDEVTITASKNKLANVCIYGQIKANELLKVSFCHLGTLTVVLKDIAGQLPNNAKQLSRDLIAASARVLRPDTSSELVRDILHYRSRKVRCMFKEWKNGKLDTPLEQRLIDCEKALLNTLELGANIPTDFMENPDINSRSMEILSKMELYIMDAAFRSMYIPTLPALIANDVRHSNHATSNGESAKRNNEQDEADVMKGDQESDAESIHASSSSFEDQFCATAPEPANQILNLTYPEQLHAALLNSASIQNNLPLNEQLKSVPLIESGNRRASIISGNTTTGSSLNNGLSSSNVPQKSMAGRKRKFEESQMEVFEMKKELLRLQQMAFERQIQMCDEIVGMLKEMRGWLQKGSFGMPQPNSVASIPQLNSLPNSLAGYPLISNQLSTNLNTLSSLLANASATVVTSPQFL